MHCEWDQRFYRDGKIRQLSVLKYAQSTWRLERINRTPPVLQCKMQSSVGQRQLSAHSGSGRSW